MVLGTDKSLLACLAEQDGLRVLVEDHPRNILVKL